ncbi:MAG: D-cysteine desulfhydrase family protein [Deltaproteobacteria bacterium]|nr:D-cysteine desulfhydrase family protein [Deltaproteobacteria bacterium]
MSEKIEYPPRVKLANTPTPLDMLGRMSDKLGVELYVKRDDLTGVELSGNKVRKLEFAFAEAINNGADTVLTCGGVQSNHARATAIAAVKLGLNSLLILRVPDPSNPPPYEGNSLLDKLVGATIVWVTPDEYENRSEIFEREADLLRKIGHKPYIIPEGASNSIGAWGYIRAVEELARDLDNLSGGRDKPTTIINAAGSGGTSAGLILGVLLFGLNVNVVSVNVCNDKDYFVRVIGDICEKTIGNYSLAIPFLRDRDINIIDGYVGKGYAISRPEELNLICDVARTEGIILDPVYTGKAFFGMIKELERKPRIFGDRIIFIHTGGIFGLFPKAEEMSALL